MWPFCLANNPLWLLLPLLIGLLTGWWAWGRKPDADLSVQTDGNSVAPTPAPPAVQSLAQAPVETTPKPIVATPRAVAPAAQPAAAIKPMASLASIGGAALTAIGIPAAIGEPDDLLQVKGIGPALNTLLNSIGVSRFDQIAAWGEAEVAKVDGHLGSFKGRVVRDSWVEQAGLLARGEIAEFEAKFGTLDSENKK